MLAHIVHPSARLCAFLDQVNLPLSHPQRRHLLNLADALLVCESRKTLAALRREFVDAPDVSNMADCLRISPWTADDLRQPLGAFLVRWAIEQAQAARGPHIIYINLDDSLAAKHKATRHLEGVDWHHDHVESTKRRPRYKNGLCYLACTVAIGTLVVTFDLRLYLRAQVQPQTRAAKARSARSRLMAPAVHDCIRDRCGWNEHHLSGAYPDGTLGAGGVRCLRLCLETALPGQIPGVLSEYGPRPERQSGVAGIWPALVVRSRQLLPQNAVGPGRFSGAALRSGGQMVRRGASGLGLHRVALRPGTVVPDPNPGRHHPTASRRACPRLADQCLRDGPRRGHDRARIAAVPAHRGVADPRHVRKRCGHLRVLIPISSTCRVRLSLDQLHLPDEGPCFFVFSPVSSREPD